MVYTMGTIFWHFQNRRKSLVYILCMCMFLDFSHHAAAGVSDPGLRRCRNEDAVIRLSGAGLYCVADGMGGGGGGDEASATAVYSLLTSFARADARCFKARKAILRDAMNQASEFILENRDSSGYRQSGTTAVTLLFDVEDPGRAVIMHAGDSRAYRFRDGNLCQLTNDHSWATRAGLSEQQAGMMGMAGIITRAVGIMSTVELDETPVEVQSGDLFLLCTDGLTGMLDDGMLSVLLRQHGGDNLDRLASVLVEAANRAGGLDNITVLLVRVDQPRS